MSTTTPAKTNQFSQFLYVQWFLSQIFIRWNLSSKVSYTFLCSAAHSWNLSMSTGGKKPVNDSSDATWSATTARSFTPEHNATPTRERRKRDKAICLKFMVGRELSLRITKFLILLNIDGKVAENKSIYCSTIPVYRGSGSGAGETQNSVMWVACTTYGTVPVPYCTPVPVNGTVQYVQCMVPYVWEKNIILFCARARVMLPPKICT